MSDVNSLKRIRKYCVICGIIYEEENKKVGLFSVPMNKLISWQAIIPKLEKTSRICCRHFDEADIIKGFRVGQNFHPADRWRLMPNAQPKHFLGDETQSNNENSNLHQEQPSQQKIFGTVQSSNVYKVTTKRILPTPGKPRNAKKTKNLNVQTSSHQGNSADATTAVSIDFSSDIAGSSSSKSIPVNISTLLPDDGHNPLVLPINMDINNTSNSSPLTQAISKATALQCHDYASDKNSSAALSNSAPANIVSESFEVLVSKFKLPCKTWKWDMSNQSCYNISYSDDEVSTKIVRVDPSTRRVSLFFNSKRITPPNFKLTFLSPAELEEIVRDFHSRKVCNGMVKFSTLNSELAVHLKENGNGNIYSEHCLGFSDSRKKICSNCHNYSGHFEKFAKKATKNKKRLKNLLTKLNTSQSRVRYINKKKKFLEVENENLKDTIVKLKSAQLDTQIQYLTPLEKIVIKTFIEKEKVEDKSGSTAMKYDKEFLNECVLLKKKSAAAYQHIRVRKLLPLPSAGTIQKLIHLAEKEPSTATETIEAVVASTATIGNLVDEHVTEIVIEMSPEAEALFNAASATSTGDTPTVIATG